MCAIIDANVVGEVFRPNPIEAARKFFEWINTGSGRLVAGGKLLKELDDGHSKFRTWRHQAVLAGKMKVANEGDVNARTEELRADGTCKSNDPHVVALAQVSGARLLYSNDKDLQQDFRNRKLINGPHGSVYTTNESKKFSASHKGLLRKKGLCQARRVRKC